ncbi:MAG: large conductance mechanosensitive channel protein MscL [Hydrogenibacillus schlegelii]|uniref:Large conductance mechanosensitive channel protein MscL n=1 Tax=Hydrogenibacillus schlegelii TaxID=1484 RepID=A0A947CX76_HYDSH|nr:large conductance mechanosensitive channel protein MscL [Hydrogenibacillus schlegelii]
MWRRWRDGWSTFWSDFRAFLSRGNAFDLAVGVIIGAAFGSIVSSLVDDLLMPLLSWGTGGLDWSRWGIVLGSGLSLEEAQAAGVPILWPGRFLNALIKFLFVSLMLFMLIRFWTLVHRRALALRTALRPDVRDALPPPEETAGGEAAAELKAKAALEEGKPAYDVERRCPFCREPIHPEAVRCPHCTSFLGDDLPGAGASLRRTAGELASDGKA